MAQRTPHDNSALSQFVPLTTDEGVLEQDAIDVGPQSPCGSPKLQCIFFYASGG